MADQPDKIPLAGAVEKITKRVSGKAWKIQKTATVRTQQPKSLRRSWEKRSEERQKLNVVKALQKQLQDDKQAEKDRKREITQERRRIEEEKARQEALAAKMSKKRLERMRRKEKRKKARVA
ncbi:hypothetical protein DM01DRAFT_1333372 [Hesseltinella vesiculosa]|uniref:rRNA-processing protein n=1 Tax=Hesseltinella vesiculosa TaxID=101127 RepID=A0A1X2GPT7_9FUNG|nr:hypothetical protein DM01DRAFT_1333372 [Hesseltinella vesiculosa]